MKHAIKFASMAALRSGAGIAGFVPGNPDLSGRQQLGPGNDGNLGGAKNLRVKLDAGSVRSSGWIASGNYIRYSSPGIYIFGTAGPP